MQRGSRCDTQVRWVSKERRTTAFDGIAFAESQQPLTFERQRTKSTDSKTSNDSGEISADDLGALSLEVLRNWTIQKRKDSTGTGRRSSDGGNGESESNLKSLINIILIS